GGFGGRNVIARWVLFNAGDSPSDGREKILLRAKPRPMPEERAVIIRKAFRNPKRRGLLPPRIIVGKHPCGPEAFDVPHMKEFMCRHADEGFRLGIVELTADPDMGVVVLQTAGGIGFG